MGSIRGNGKKIELKQERRMSSIEVLSLVTEFRWSSWVRSRKRER